MDERIFGCARPFGAAAQRDAGVYLRAPTAGYTVAA
jgi:hypothetical protein